MKIIQINTFPNKAAGNIMMNIHKTLLDNKIDSYVVWGRGRTAVDHHEYYMHDDLGVKLHGVYTRITDKHGYASKSATRKLLRWIENIGPDIVHLHCIHGYYINIELLFEYLKKNNIRVIWTQHDCWSFTGHCAYFDAIGCEKWKKGCFKCKQLRTYPASRILDNSMWNWENKKALFSGVNLTLVTPCIWLANKIKDSFLNEYPVKIIYNGIDTEVFKKTNSDFKIKNRIDRKKIILGVAGEWTERKGLKDFIKMNESIDHKKYVIVVVGVTERQKKELSESIIAINRTESIEKLVDIYSSADVFFNPTYEDNFPTTNLEALACGTPVITYDTGGCSECIENNKNGFVVKKGDLNAVLEIIKDDTLVPVIDFASFKFSKKDMIRSYINLYYEKVVQSNSSD